MNTTLDLDDLGRLTAAHYIWRQEHAEALRLLREQGAPAWLRDALEHERTGGGLRRVPTAKRDARLLEELFAD